jgi:hypothetical protein
MVFAGSVKDSVTVVPAPTKQQGSGFSENPERPLLHDGFAERFAGDQDGFGRNGCIV